MRTLRQWIERDAPNAILLHAGDFLSLKADDETIAEGTTENA